MPQLRAVVQLSPQVGFPLPFPAGQGHVIVRLQKLRLQAVNVWHRLTRVNEGVKIQHGTEGCLPVQPQVWSLSLQPELQCVFAESLVGKLRQLTTQLAVFLSGISVPWLGSTLLLLSEKPPRSLGCWTLLAIVPADLGGNFLLSFLRSEKPPHWLLYLCCNEELLLHCSQPWLAQPL